MVLTVLGNLEATENKENPFYFSVEIFGQNCIFGASSAQHRQEWLQALKSMKV
jgi:hypothetical protein